MERGKEGERGRKGEREGKRDEKGRGERERGREEGIQSKTETALSNGGCITHHSSGVS